MKHLNKLAILLLFMFAANVAWSQETIVLKAMKSELQRIEKELKQEETPPYFMSYSIQEVESVSIVAQFGKVITNKKTHKRTLDLDFRVGDYEFDNTHIIRGQPFNFGGSFGAHAIPIENNEAAIKKAIWYASDATYKSAIQRYEKALTNKAVKVQEEDTSADFSYEKPVKSINKKIDFKFNAQKWEDKIREISTHFIGNDWLYIGQVSIQAKVTTKYFVSSEGAEIQVSEPYYRIFLAGKTKADDGMSLPLYKSYFAFSPDDFPNMETIEKDCKAIIDMLAQLREAPLFNETYSGPAILSGEASGVFFHEIFGHRIEGHRLKDPSDAQTFKKSIGEEVLPTFMNVDMDPTRKKLDEYDLSGYYQYDDEGTKAQKVEVVRDGVFLSFLMSRSPIEGFKKSNGHGRKQAGFSAVSRQSNLIVSANDYMPIEELREELIEQCEDQDKEYGLYFIKVQGGFTFTGRSIPNSFNVNPLIVYKVFTDGRPDELVRGVDLIGTPLTTFSNIIGAGDDLGVFNGICGAESGGVPVSAASPSLLVSTIEVQRKAKSQAKNPILSAPTKKEN
jgi:TldD protein